MATNNNDAGCPEDMAIQTYNYSFHEESTANGIFVEMCDVQDGHHGLIRGR